MADALLPRDAERRRVCTYKRRLAAAPAAALSEVRADGVQDVLDAQLAVGVRSRRDAVADADSESVRVLGQRRPVPPQRRAAGPRDGAVDSAATEPPRVRRVDDRRGARAAAERHDRARRRHEAAAVPQPYRLELPEAAVRAADRPRFWSRRVAVVRAQFVISGGGARRGTQAVEAVGERVRARRGVARPRRRRGRRRRSRGRRRRRLRRRRWGPRSLFLLQAARVGRVPRLRLAARTRARLLQRPRVGRVARLGLGAARGCVEERVDAAEAALLRDGRRGRVPPVQPLLARAGQELLLGPREGLVLAPRGRRRLAPRRDRLGPGRVEGVEERVVVGRLCERRRRPGFWNEGRRLGQRQGRVRGRGVRHFRVVDALVRVLELVVIRGGRGAEAPGRRAARKFYKVGRRGRRARPRARPREGGEPVAAAPRVSHGVAERGRVALGRRLPRSQ